MIKFSLAFDYSVTSLDVERTTRIKADAARGLGALCRAIMSYLPKLTGLTVGVASAALVAVAGVSYFRNGQEKRPTPVLNGTTQFPLITLTNSKHSF